MCLLRWKTKQMCLGCSIFAADVARTTTETAQCQPWNMDAWKRACADAEQHESNTVEEVMFVDDTMNTSLLVLSSTYWMRRAQAQDDWQKNHNLTASTLQSSSEQQIPFTGLQPVIWAEVHLQSVCSLLYIKVTSHFPGLLPHTNIKLDPNCLETQATKLRRLWCQSKQRLLDHVEVCFLSCCSNYPEKTTQQEEN